MLKIQLWSPDTCGCSFHQAWDDNVPEHLLPGTAEAQIYHELPASEPYFVEYEQAIEIVNKRRDAEAKVWQAVRQAHKAKTIDETAALRRLGLHRDHQTPGERSELARVFLHELGPVPSNVNSKPQPRQVLCEHHAHLASPSHYETALTENRRKNESVQAVTDSVALPTILVDGAVTSIHPSVFGIEYRPMWAFDSDRVLHVSHTHLATHGNHSEAQQRIYDAGHSNRDVTVHLDHKEFDWQSCKYRG